LIDAGGNDIFKAANAGANGGGTDGGTGLLLNVGGNDEYEAGTDGANGGNSIGAAGLPGAGLLIDTGGRDDYLDNNVPQGTGHDKTVTPKGPGGAQIDENSPSADLDVQIGASPNPVPSGRNLTYTIAVRNDGPPPRSRIGDPPSDPSGLCSIGVSSQGCYPPNADAGPDIAEQVELIDELPPGVNLTSATPTSGVCVTSERTLKCGLGDIASGSSATVSLVVTPHNSPGSIISNTASARSQTPDPDESNNQATVAVTVIDGAPVEAVSIGDATAVPEGNAGTKTQALFPVSLSQASNVAVTVDYSTADDTAKVSDNDYVSTSGTLTFDPGQTAKEISAPIAGDSTSEGDEMFFVKLSNPANAIVDNGQGAATIVDDDPLPVASIGGQTVKEGDSGITFAEFTVSITSPAGRSVSVDYATADGSAAVGDSDYQAAKGTLTFAPGQKTQALRVKINGDTKAEIDETFFVDLKNPKNVSIGEGHGLGSILDDDVAISISQYVPAREGDSGTTDAVMTVSLSPESRQTVTVDYASVDGTATTPSDYQPVNGTLTFEPGQKTQELAVKVKGDTQIEPNENLFVRLSNPQHAHFEQLSLEEEVLDRGEVAILDDDAKSAKGAGAGGGVFITQHTVDTYATSTPNTGYRNRPGAKHIIQQAIAYATDGRPDVRVLLVEGRAGPSDETVSLPGDPLGRGSITGASERGIRAIGFEQCPARGPRGCFELADYLGGAERIDLNKVAFSDYDAVIVSSSQNFRKGDLDTLNRRRDDLLDAVHHGTGLAAFGEYFETYPLDSFGFLPCLRPFFDEAVDQTGADTYEPTPFGRSLGLTDADFGQQGTENFFVPPACGLEAVNLNAFGLPVSLAGHLPPGVDSTHQSLPPALPAVAAGTLPPQATRPPDEGPSLPKQNSPRSLPSRPPPAEKVQAPPALNQAQQQSQQQAQGQMQAQMQQLAQANNVQAQPVVHVQGAVTREKGKAPELEVAQIEDRAPQTNQAPAKQKGYLASAQQPALPVGVIAAGAASLALFLFGLARPKRQRTPRAAILYIHGKQTRCTGSPPRHRKR